MTIDPRLKMLLDTIKLFENFTINDLLFIIIQLILLSCVVLSIYISRLKPTMNALQTKWRMKTDKRIRALTSWYKQTKSRLIRNFRSNTHDSQLIVADSVMSVSVTGNARIVVNRGESSWGYFGLAWTVLSVFIIEANSLYSSSFVENYSILILVADLVAITYLCFISSWFRNKVISVVNLRNKTPE